MFFIKNSESNNLEKIKPQGKFWLLQYVICICLPLTHVTSKWLLYQFVVFILRLSVHSIIWQKQKVNQIQ